ncbi:MAG: DUF2442 domain-containing protein [Oscillospiraceae bacterium]|nr:DUF2442 domain-containing protein [Oscillospiraceae bacterium]
MYIKDDIVYANTLEKDIKLIDFKIIAELYLLLTFSTGEKRVLDFKPFLEYPIYAILSDLKKFEQAHIDNGLLTWDGGNIDISPETLYANSYEYNDILVM